MPVMTLGIEDRLPKIEHNVERSIEVLRLLWKSIEESITSSESRSEASPLLQTVLESNNEKFNRWIYLIDLLIESLEKAQDLSKTNVTFIMNFTNQIKQILQEADEIDRENFEAGDDNLVLQRSEGTAKAADSFKALLEPIQEDRKASHGKVKAFKMFDPIKCAAAEYANESHADGFRQGYLVGRLGVRPGNQDNTAFMDYFGSLFRGDFDEDEESKDKSL